MDIGLVIIILILIGITIAILYKVSATKRPCPFCRTMMPQKTTMCPHCHRLVPLGY